MRLAGKTAIVTGGASGFGAGIVRKFVAEGARVIIADINEAGAGELAKELGAKALAQLVDVSKSASVEAMSEIAVETFGHVDILVNNAGVTHQPGPLADISEDEFDRVLAVNAKSVFLTA
ncbi:MAG TPA: SDR family NAD(P)-dependent oxidoreductase, partial [Devosia sp.]|nr:SDR family NAD(P)-dependent oxidoreductase [Devosia sp.]